MEKEADLNRWFKEKWVDISRKDESGKHPECGRSDADKGAYPKCRPSKKVSKETPTVSKSLSKRDKKKAVNIKRRKESSAPNESAGGGARKPKYTKLSGDNMGRMISKRASEKYHEDEKLYMIKKNLFTMMNETKEMYESVEDGKDVPEWCQEKLAVAANMIDTVFEYLGFEKEMEGKKHFHHDHSKE
jgi:hypothetical protein